MAKIDFYTLEKKEKEAVFNAIAADKNMTAFAVGKDSISNSMRKSFLLS